jgi:hypothetical protein
MEDDRTNFTSYIIGGLVGAAIGVAAAYLIENSTELEEGEGSPTFKKYSRLGLGAISMLWGLINPGKGKGFRR